MTASGDDVTLQGGRGGGGSRPPVTKLDPGMVFVILVNNIIRNFV